MMLTRKIIRDLFDHLTNEGYYSSLTEAGDNKELNRSISDKWRNKIEAGLTADFKRMLSDAIQVEQKNSRFDIEDSDERGATIWKSFVTLIDKDEKMDVVINFIVNHDNAFIYLGASHSNLDLYTGESLYLKSLFRQLKANEKIGHFLQTVFYNLD